VPPSLLHFFFFFFFLFILFPFFVVFFSFFFFLQRRPGRAGRGTGGWGWCGVRTTFSGRTSFGWKDELNPSTFCIRFRPLAFCASPGKPTTNGKLALTSRGSGSVDDHVAVSHTICGNTRVWWDERFIGAVSRYRICFAGRRSSWVRCLGRPLPPGLNCFRRVLRCFGRERYGRKKRTPRRRPGRKGSLVIFFFLCFFFFFFFFFFVFFALVVEVRIAVLAPGVLLEWSRDGRLRTTGPSGGSTSLFLKIRRSLFRPNLTWPPEKSRLCCYMWAVRTSS